MKQTDFAEQLTQALDLRVCCFCSVGKRKSPPAAGAARGQKKESPSDNCRCL